MIAFLTFYKAHLMSRITSKIPFVFSCLALALSIFAFCQTVFKKDKEEENEAFKQKLLTHIRACIDYSKEIPRKEEIYSLLEEVEKNDSILETGSDDLRVKYVNSQGCIEHVLACSQALGEIVELIGVIHTPTPATPLCVKPEGNIEGILDQSIRFDLHKLLTVRSRAQIVREYLANGGKLYVVYPKGGFEKRNSDQQKVYKDELQKFAGNLIDWVMSCTEMNQDMIGATYLFRNQDRQIFAFSIKSRQVNDIQKQAEWGIWFGPISQSSIKDRVNLIFDYLVQNGGPDVRMEI